MVDRFSTADPIVAFVGAGASAIPPSSLPTWTEFNTLLLEALCERLATFSENRQPTAAMLETFRRRRDQTHFFAPDFQAQLIEEEIGKDYFKVWQSLETSEFGPVHRSLAELAARGHLAAIVTPNFDRLIEAALTARGVRFEVYHDADRFGVLQSTLEAADHPLPVVKIHGSIEDAPSLVDTLRQRIAGRPGAVMRALATLLHRHRWVFLGFSGADFSYDAHYLGVLGEAERARGFVFVSRPRAALQQGVLTIAAAYGPRKASIVVADLAGYLPLVCDLPAEPTLAGAVQDAAPAVVKTRIAEWVESLGPMSVVNVLCAMLRSSGLEYQATWLLRKTWKRYRSGEDTEHPAYARYNYNYGVSLFEAGFISNPLALADDMSNVPDWKTHADENAFEFLARAYKSGRLPAAGVQLAALLAYRGEVGRAIAIGAEATEQAIAGGDPLVYCDAAIASVPLYDIVQTFQAPVLQLQRCVGLARTAGDEPRRAMLCGHLGRLLTYQGEFAAADAALTEADRIARRLDLRNVLTVCRAARGVWLADSQTSAQDAVSILSDVADALGARDDEPLVTRYDLADPNAAPTVMKGTNPFRCRVLLDLNRAALLAGDGDRVNETLDALDEMTTAVFLGYCPHYYVAYAQCILTAENDRTGRVPLVTDLLGRALQLGESQGNPWVAQAVTHLKSQIAQA